MSKKAKDKADAAAPENEHIETETQSADANQVDSSTMGALDLGPDTATDGTDDLAAAGTDDAAVGAGQADSPASEADISDEQPQDVAEDGEAVDPDKDGEAENEVQTDIPADGAAAEGNGEGSQPSNEGPQEAEGATEGSNHVDTGESSEAPAEPEPPARDSELTYRPLMTDEDIARAATDAAIAVAYQAGFASTLTDEDELVLKLIAPVAVDFIKQWPDAPLEAMYVHIATSAKLPHDRFGTRPNWVRLGLAVFHSVVLLSIDAVKVHEKEWEAAKVRQAGLRWMAVDRADLAMMPEEDNPLSELGQAAARS